MFALRTPIDGLTRLLRPVAAELDRCWWYFGGCGCGFPAHRMPEFKRNPERLPPAEREAYYREYLERSAQWSRDIEAYCDGSHGYSVGKPGFFSRFADGFSGDWTAYCAVDSQEAPWDLFDVIDQSLPRLFNEPETLSTEILLSVRGIDNGYWDFFFREQEMGERALKFLRTGRVKGVEELKLPLERD